jgi:hypothetical protein
VVKDVTPTRDRGKGVKGDGKGTTRNLLVEGEEDALIISESLEIKASLDTNSVAEVTHHLWDDAVHHGCFK